MKRIVQLVAVCGIAVCVLAGCQEKSPTAKKLDELRDAAKDLQRDATDAAKDLQQGASNVLEDASKTAEDLLKNISK